jgi:hypothetical protein
MTDDLAALPPTTAAGLDDVTERALDLVVDANADLDVWFAVGAGALEGRPAAVARFVHRTGLALDVADHVHGGVVVVLPTAESVRLCQAFCRRERLTVLAHLSAVERRIDRGEPAPGGERTARRARSLVRAWVEGDDGRTRT